MTTRSSPPRVLDLVLKVAYAIKKQPLHIDPQRLCILVSDAEWDALVNYQLDIKYSDGSDHPQGMSTMSIMDVEIIKRSSITRSYYEEYAAEGPLRRV